MTTATSAAPRLNGPVKLSYTHEAMVDLIIAEPSVTPGELAEIFSYSPGWISRVIASDAFQARLGSRKAQLIDPVLARGLDERLRGVAMHSIALIEEKLGNESDSSAQYAMDALGLCTTAMGLQRRQQR
jgi:hypothetical protein